MEKNIGANGVNWYLFRESRCPFLDTFFEIYKQDRMHAKIVHSNNKGKFSYSITRDVLFEFPNGDFKISRMTRKFGMSITNIVYHRESTEWSLSYKKATKKFYYIKGKNVMQVTFNTLLSIMPTSRNTIPTDYPIYKYLLEQFGWLRNIGEDKRLHSISFSTIMSKKLFNVKKALSHVYGVPYPVADVLSKNQLGYSPWDFIRVWKQIKRALVNVENLNSEFLNSHYFLDACRLGGLLGKKVNCSWSIKRLKAEHDEWSKEVSNIVMKYEPVIVLNTAQVYKDFAEFSGYELLTTNHELINEGRIMRHCVGSYANSVNSGSSGILRVENHTLEVGYRHTWDRETGQSSIKQLGYGQLKGVGNINPPKDLDAGVKMMIKAFNEFKGEYQYPQHVQTHSESLFDELEAVDLLPF